ncbi:MAG: DNA-binding protein [Kiritimatiellales bacterium]|nr:DNA-binding protein [Kiritimatiellales bacterium]
MNLNHVNRSNTFMVRLPHGCDLAEELTAICMRAGITLGEVRAIGAVQKACIAFYDQQERVYKSKSFNHPLEIAQLTGNISMKDGKPFIHAHVTLTDEDGNAFGGHLAAGTIVFACETVIDVFDGPSLERSFDEQTGLGLWGVPNE